MSTSPAAVDPQALAAVLERMLGDVPTFMRDYWHKRPLHVSAADPHGTIRYGVDDFLADLVAMQPVPYGAVKIKDGRRFDSFHQTSDALRDAVADGSVCAIKLSRLWHGTIPESWVPMRDLFAQLCRTVATVYMTPQRSEDVDLFFAGPDSCLGTHFDTTDVFTLQLFGERRWTVEEEFSLDGILDVGRDPSWYPTREIGFPGPTREITLRAGDALYVPAYTVHRVTGVSWSVSLSLGLRAFNEIDVVEHLLERLRLSSYLKYPPFAGAPEALEAEHAEAKLELMQRVRTLLQQVEGLAVAFLLAPLRLPPSLNATSPTTDAAPAPSASSAAEPLQERANS